jgi:hypothetical protein
MCNNLIGLKLKTIMHTSQGIKVLNGRVNGVDFNK